MSVDLKSTLRPNEIRLEAAKARRSNARDTGALGVAPVDPALCRREDI